MLSKRTSWWLPLLIVVLCTGLIAASTFALPQADADQLAVSLQKVTGYLSNDEPLTDWKLALGLAGQGNNKAQDYQVDVDSLDPSNLTKVESSIIGLIAAQKDPAAVKLGENNLIQILVAAQEANGRFGPEGSTLNTSIWAVIALDFAAQNKVPGAAYDIDKAVQYIVGCQKEDGGFDESGWGVDADSTAHALIALAPHLEKNNPVVQKALDYLHSKQLASGGIDNWGDNPASTAAVIEALIALGENPQSPEWTPGDNTLVDNLLSYQNSEGAFIQESDWGPIDHSPFALLALVDLVNDQSKYQSQVNFSPSDSNNSPGETPPAGNGGNEASQPDPGNSNDVVDLVKVTISIDGGSVRGSILSPRQTSFSASSNKNALQILIETVQNAGLDYEVVNNTYVASIAGLREKEYGPMSGWLFKVNGVLSSVGAATYLLHDGDYVEWFYSSDDNESVDPLKEEPTAVEPPKKPQPVELNEEQKQNQTPEPAFGDLQGYEWAANSINQLAQRGIISGTGSGFEPGREINRAEFITLLIKAQGQPAIPDNPMVFEDVQPDDWFYQAVQGAAGQFVSGYTDGQFRPYQSISRYEVASMLARFDHKLPLNPPISFNDTAGMPGWAGQGIDYVSRTGLMSGYPDGSFMGNSTLTRAEAAAILFRYLELSAAQG